MNTKRDFVGYGPTTPPNPWPNAARVAVSFVLNYEEGSEPTVLDGDQRGESLGEVPRVPQDHERDLAMESFYEYGSRAGVWRLLAIFDRRALPLSIYACSVAVERNPEFGRYLSTAARHEVVCHGYRWEEVSKLNEQEEREHIALAVESLVRTTGRRPRGWYCRYAPSTRTRRLLVETGGFEYDCDSYADDLPFMVDVDGHDWCVVPHALDTNDVKFWRGGMSTAADFFGYLRDSFDYLYREGATAPKMLTISLHARVAGRPGRAVAVERFVDYVASFPDAWITTRGAIARAWRSPSSTPAGDPTPYPG